MLQRIQTVYLLLSAVALFVCLCLPLASFEPQTMEDVTVIYNLWIQFPDGTHSFVGVGLFVALAAAMILSVMNIFGYKNRRRQSRQCLMTMIVILLWSGLFAVVLSTQQPEGTTMTVLWGVCLPVVALVLQWMARHGILADEKLVRAADRIR